KQVRASLNRFKEQVTEAKADEKGPTVPKKPLGKTKNLTSAPKEIHEKPAAGDAVRIKGQTSVGEVMDVSGKKVTVAFGMIKTTVNIESLERVSNNQLKKEKKASNTRDLLHERKLNFRQDIDVRGMRGDEALQAVMYFIDDALQLGVSRVRILHGTGTGALRQIIREYLGTVGGVTHFQDEHIQFGGTGITVIDLV
ncbi:MAG TPA: endonuclease MutS2, partial [Porphyromonadaceae bacterium]|nr:endonuclease MutS2 [Porphyromonadaceae bacterium]